MKRKILAALICISILGITACSPKSGSSAPAADAAADKGSVEKSVDTASSEADEEEEYDDYFDEEEEEEDDPVAEAAEWIDEVMTEKWDKDNDGHEVTYDPDRIFVHAWQEAVDTKEDVDEANFRNDIIPSWISATDGWAEELKNRGLDVGLTFQYINYSEDQAIFTIEDGKLTYFIYD